MTQETDSTILLHISWPTAEVLIQLEQRVHMVLFIND